jgi:MerR family transcriptional regulator, light-induced transcriptional regulator
MPAEELLRIGELSKRAGVSAEALRAWERRYALLRPTRSPGGLRLYSPDDLERVRKMKGHLAAGLAAAEAARLASASGAEDSRSGGADLVKLRAALATAVERFDEATAQAILDRAVSALSVDALLVELILPYLHELGERWERGGTSVAQEHFASALVRGRLLGLARGWGLGLGPTALLACLPGELHDLGLIAFGLALRARGWRIVFLGADTPAETIETAARTIDPALVVLSGVSPKRLVPVIAKLQPLAARHSLAIGGACAESPAAARVAGLVLAEDPVSEADRVTSLHAHLPE